MRYLCPELGSPPGAALSDLIDLSRDMLCVIGKDGHFLVTNRAFQNSFGYSKTEFAEKGVLHFIHPDDHVESKKAFCRILTSTTSSQLQNRFQCKDGAYRMLNWELSAVQDKGVVYARVAIDVNSNRQVERSPVASEHLNRSIIQSSGDCIKILDLDGRLQYMSQGGQELLHIQDIEPYLGIAYEDFWEGSDKEATRKAIADARRGHQGRFQGYAPTVEGEPRWWDVVITPIVGEDRSPENLLVISRDITERIRAEKALADSEQLLRKAQTFAQIGHWTLEADMRTAYWSEEIYQITGQKSDVVPGPETLGKIVHPIDIDSAFDSLRNAMTLGQEHDVEYRIIRPDNEVRWIACKATPVIDESGEVVRLSGIIQDITKRKQSEEQIQASLDEKEVLLREVHHRVKNNLQVIASLLSLQAMHINSQEAINALNESARRVQLMAKIHNRLYRSTNLARVEFDLFLRSLAEEMLVSHSHDRGIIRFHFNLDSVVLSVGQAIPCSQIVSELISNSIKHAFTDGGLGNISISLAADSEKIQLVIVDDGVGVPEGFDIHCSQSLGLKVVQALASQLNADLELKRENGTYCKLSFDRE